MGTENGLFFHGLCPVGHKPDLWMQLLDCIEHLELMALEHHSPFYLIVHHNHPIHLSKPNGGAETATLNQARFINRTGRKVVVAAFLPEGSTVQDGIEYWDIGKSYDIQRILERAETLGTYYLLSVGGAMALWLSRRLEKCRLRVFVSHSGTASHIGVPPSALGEVVDFIFGVSHAQVNKLITEGAPQEKMQVVSNGVDLSIFPASASENHNPMKLIFCGALVPDKGLHVLITSFIEVKQRFPALQLDIYGSAALWSREPYLDAEHIQRTVPGITFHGAIPQQELAKAYASAGLCIVPSIWFDSFNTTSLEAQVCGCPVVVFNTGGNPEGVTEGVTGVVVHDVTEKGLTEALIKLLSNQQYLQTLSKGCLEVSRVKFDLQNVIQNIISICENAAHSVGFDSFRSESLLL